MSNKQTLKEAIEAFIKAKEEAAKEVSKAIETVRQHRETETGQSTRQG